MIEDLPSEEQLADKRWRLENLYYITNKDGEQVLFKLNWAQEELLDRYWYQMLILKARQLGCTTFFSINFLDDCFWMPTINAGIIAHRKEDAEDIFKKKVKFAYDRMPSWTRVFNTATNDRVGELTFRNGSSYRVSTGFRSGTYQRMLISEFGKICAKSPDTAKEIVTGSINTVGRDQILVIESTAEGREGFYFDYCKEAEKLVIEKREISPMQKRFFFFPWYREPGYSLDDESIIVTQEIDVYLDGIEKECNVQIFDDQRRWYQIKNDDMADSMKQEYPSTPSEAFEASNEGLYYGKQIAKLRSEGHITRVPYQECSPVHTSFDLGYSDHTVIWFFQIGHGGAVDIIDYFEYVGEGAKFYIDYLKSKPYTYGSHILPHDGARHDSASGFSWQEQFSELMDGVVLVLPLNGKDATSVLDGIQAVRSLLGRCYFDQAKCSKGVSQLEAYKKEWNDKLGCYRSSPLHDASSHSADSFRYLAVGLDKVGGKHLTKDQIKKIRNEAGYK